MRRVMLIPVQTHSLHPSALRAAVLPHGGAFRERAEFAIPPSLPPGIVYDAAVDESQRLWIVHDSPGSPDLVLSAFERGEVLTRSDALPLATPDLKTAATITLAATGAMTCLTYGNSLHVIPHGLNVPSAKLDLARPAVSAVASPPHTRPRAAIAFAEGACVCWPVERHIAPFAVDMLDPVVGMTRDGLLVAASRQRVAVYRVEQMEPRLVATAGPRAPLPIAVMSAPGEGSFAILYADGLVQIMKFVPAGVRGRGAR
jgi:hypothetical protein